MSRRPYAWLFFVLAVPALAKSDWVLINSGDKWTRAGTYIFGSVTFVIECEQGRRCEAGTGLYFGGKPRGSRRKFSGRIEMTAYGTGTLQVRADDGQGSVRVAYYEKSASTIPVYPAPWHG